MFAIRRDVLLNRFSHRGAKFSIITGSIYEIGSRPCFKRLVSYISPYGYASARKLTLMDSIDMAKHWSMFWMRSKQNVNSDFPLEIHFMVLTVLW